MYLQNIKRLPFVFQVCFFFVWFLTVYDDAIGNEI